MMCTRTDRGESGLRGCVLFAYVLLPLAITLAGAPAAAEPSAVPMGEEAIVFQEIPSVYGASRFEQKVTEAPSFVTLITSSDIKRHGHRTLAEVLSGVPGFFVTYDRNYNYLGIRGFNRPGDFNTRVLLLVDGHRLNDNLYSQAGLGTESLIDVELIDRVEVIRGPSSSLYGTNAFFGVINVVTKRGRDIRGLEVSSEAGSFQSYKTRTTYGQRFSNGVEAIVSGSYYKSNGQSELYYPEFDAPATNNGITRGADDDKYPNLFTKLSYKDFTLQAGHVSREKGIPTASYGTFFPTTRTRSTDEHSYVSLKYERVLPQGIDLETRIYYDRFYYQGDYLYDIAAVPPPVLVLNRDKSTGEWWGAEAKLRTRLFENHNVTVGIEYTDNFRQDLYNADIAPTVVLLDEKRSTRNWALFTQDEFSITDNLILNAGVRYDYYESFGGKVSPRLALIQNFKNSTFKAIYGQAFRAPNAYERFYTGTGFQANPALDPENITTYELVFEQPLSDNFRLTAGGYFYVIDELVSLVTDPFGSLIFENAGKTEAKGFELQLEMDDRDELGISGRLGYALQRATDKRTGDRLTNSPTHLLNLNAAVPVYGDMLSAGVELLYMSSRDTLAGASASGYTTTNLTLFSKDVIKGLEISASVRNLFDKTFSDPGSGEQVQDEIEQDGRTFWLKVKYGF